MSFSILSNQNLDHKVFSSEKQKSKLFSKKNVLKSVFLMKNKHTQIRRLIVWERILETFLAAICVKSFSWSLLVVQKFNCKTSCPGGERATKLIEDNLTKPRACCSYTVKSLDFGAFSATKLLNLSLFFFFSKKFYFANG